MPWDPEFWTQIISNILLSVTTWLPTLVGSLLILFLGWLVARLSQFFLAGLLQRLGLDRLAQRAGAVRALGMMGLDSSISVLLARLVYWLILLVFVLAAVDSLGLEGVTATLGGLIAYLPSVLAAVLILLVGSVIARIVGEAVGAMATRSGIAGGVVVGQVVRYTLFIFAAILALEQLGVQTVLLTTVAVAIIAATALALALAFGLGNRELALNIMAGFHAKEAFAPGQVLKVGDHNGRLLHIGPLNTLFETEAGRLSVPNIVLVNEEVLILPPVDTDTIE